jgi:hypothetical protein
MKSTFARALFLTTVLITGGGRFGASSARADDNPFGLPEPTRANKQGSIMLHGGGNTAEIYDLVPRLTGKDRPTLEHCPTASDSYRRMSGNELMASDLAAVWKTDAASRLLTPIVPIGPSSPNSASCSMPRTRCGSWAAIKET